MQRPQGQPQRGCPTRWPSSFRLPRCLRAARLYRRHLEGYEADDLLGTIAAAAEREGDECVLVTGDRDSFQLVSSHVSVYLAANSETKVYDPARITAEYGVAPAQLVDVKAIMGDASDNIKGRQRNRRKRARWR